MTWNIIRFAVSKCLIRIVEQNDSYVAQCLPCSWKSDADKITPVSRAARQHVSDAKNKPVLAGSSWKSSNETSEFWDVCPNCGGKNLSLLEGRAWNMNIHPDSKDPIQGGVAVCNDCRDNDLGDRFFEVILDKDSNKWLGRENWFLKRNWKNLNKAAE